jgi:hypothetical protein
VQALLDCLFALLDLLLSIGGRGVVLPPTGVAALHQFSPVDVHRSLTRPRATLFPPVKAVALIC